MTPETKASPTKRVHTAALSVAFGTKLSELANAHSVSVAEYCDSEFGEAVEFAWREMMKAKLNNQPLPPLRKDAAPTVATGA